MKEYLLISLLKALHLTLFVYGVCRLKDYGDLGENVPATLLDALSAHKEAVSWKK
jgi:hypothetical protein